MAKERYFTGFEDANDYQFSSSPAVGGYICDGTARTGDFVARAWNPQGTQPTRVVRSFSGGPYTCTNDGDRVVARMQVAFRLAIYPGNNGSHIYGYGLGNDTAPVVNAAVLMSTTGALSVYNTMAGTFQVNWTAALSTWYIGRVELRYQRNNAGLDPYTLNVWVYPDVDWIDDDTPPLVTLSQTGTANFTGFQLNSPNLGPNATDRRVIDYDDWWYSVASEADAATTDTNWPVGTRVMPVVITGQNASSAGFAGSYLLARDIPNSAVSGNEQTTATPGATSIFTHQTAAELGLIPANQLPTASAADQAAAPPFSGITQYLDELSSQGFVYFPRAVLSALPVPTIQSFTLTAGAGQFTSGVWARAFTVRQTGGPGDPGTTYEVSPLSDAVFLSAAAAPNFKATLEVAFNAATPADAFENPADPGNSMWHRYAVGVLITNAYNTAGLLNPETDIIGQIGSMTNVSNLETYGGPGAIDAGPFGSLVALFRASATGSGGQPPYPATNPSVRPSVVTFVLTSPQQSAPVGGTISPTYVDTWSYLFRPPALAAGETPKPIAEAFKVTAPMQLSVGTQAQNYLVNGTVVNAPTITTNYSNAQCFGIDWTPRDAAGFDAMTFGVQSNAALAATLRLGQCVGEVLTAGPGVRRNTGSGQYQQQAGIYVSNAGFQKIALPFKPTFVMVKRIGNTASAGAVKGWWCGGTQSWGINNINPNPLGIMLLEDDGFVVGSDNIANGAAATYAYLAIADGQEDTVNDAYCVTGSYFRQSSADPDDLVTLPLSLKFAGSWTPDVLFEFSSLTTLRTPDMAAGLSDLFNQTALIATGFTAIGDRTFNTGSSIEAQGQHFYVAFKFDVAGLLATVFQYGAFAGNNATQVIPTNFRGELIVLDHTAAAGYTGRFRSDQGNAGNNSVPWLGGVVTTTDITAIGNADFTVGAGASVTGFTSYWTAWKKDGSIGNRGSSALPPPSEPGPDPAADDDLCGGGGMKLPPGSTGEAGCTAC